MSVSRGVRVGWVFMSTAVLCLGSVSAASATTDPEMPPPPPEEIVWPPADTDGEWLPVPQELFTEYEVSACGGTVLIAPGDEFGVEYQAAVQEDGTERVEYRGSNTVDITRAPDGAMVDELDNGGAYSEIYSADGSMLTFSADGPSVFIAFDAVEAATFAAQGLPPLFHYDSGSFAERVTFSDDPAATTILAAEVLTDTARGVSDVCDLLDDAADG